MRLESTVMGLSGIRLFHSPGRQLQAALAIALAGALVLPVGCTPARKSAPPPSGGIIANTDRDSEPVSVPEVTEWPYAETPPVPDGYDVHKRLLDVTFPAGSASLDNEARGALSEAVSELEVNSAWHALVVGFSDGRGESGALAKTRAEAVSKLLESRGIDASRLSVLALGSAYAQADEFQPEQLRRDRRVEIWAFGR